MADDYLTVDEVAAQLAVPVEMVQRRIESGDIPVHWVETGGKLEMRISSAEIGVEQPAAATPFPTPEALESEAAAPQAPESSAPGWSVRPSDYSQDVWGGSAEEPAAAAAGTPEEENPAPWAVEPEPGPELGGTPEPGPELPPAAEESSPPVWSAEPSTWEDEPLERPAESAAWGAPSELPETAVWGPEPAPAAEEPAEEGAVAQPPAFPPAPADAFFPLDEEEDLDESSYGVPPPPAASAPFAPVEEAPAPAPEPVEAVAEEQEEEEEEVSLAEGEDLGEESDLLSGDSLLPSEFLGTEAPAPASLVPAPGPESIPGLSSIDARELVSGLFERWERALEQRIQAEQRLRWEAELERRMRQVRDLKQELENTRKANAAQLAEREQEVLALRNRLREQGEAQGKGRGLFRR